MNKFAHMADMAREAATAVAHWGQTRVTQHGSFTLALSGGRTPYCFLRHLAKQPVPWRQTHIFWVDERCVPHGRPESNFTLVNDALLKELPCRVGGVYPIPVEDAPARCATAYAHTLQEVFARRLKRTDYPPVFDCMQLGLGQDGHVGSLFPTYSEPQGAEASCVVAVPEAGLPPFVPRISLSLRTMAAARNILFLVAGEEKQRLLCAIRRGEHAHLPVARLIKQAPAERIHWYIANSA